MGWLKRKLKAAANAVKNAAKKVWRFAKGVVRLGLRAAAFLWGLLVVGLPDLVLGWLLPAKKLRLQVYILADPATGRLTATREQVQAAIDDAILVFKDRVKVKIIPYGRQFIEVIDHGVPAAAINVKCGIGGFLEDLGEAGEFFANHLAGWKAGLPVSPSFPITVYVVGDVAGKGGCSPIGPMADYVTVDYGGIDVPDESLLAHELGHACGQFWHSLGESNLMYGDHTRKDTLHWWQKNLFRTSRHVTWW